MTHDTTTAIRLTGLVKRYGSKTAVDGLDLEVPSGSVFGFLGPNGAGKTTTIRIMLGLVRPTAGRVELLGEALPDARERVARRVGSIVETPTFYPQLSGEENLRVIALTAGLSPRNARIESLLHRVGLTEAGEKRVCAYSLGMRQRLGLAAALLADPDILFLDEPTNGLDPAGTVEMRELVRSLSREGRTVFVSSHLLAEVEQMCTHAAILSAGRLRARGTVAELLSGTARFALRAEPQPRALAALAAHAGIAASAEGEWLTIEADEERLAEAVGALVAAGCRVYRVEERRGNLETLFLEMTGAETARSAREAATHHA